MPFLPQAATPAHIDVFARRLAHHLSDPHSRQSLMALQEAFARASGFPDSHAAQAMATRERLSFNPLAGLGQKPVEITGVPALRAIRASHLSSWASQSWKRQRALLAQSPFGLEDARALLASAWGYESWESCVLAFENRISKVDKIHGIRIAKNYADLLEACAGSDLRPNFKGLHSLIGYTPEGSMVGMDFRQSLAHCLVLDENATRRAQFASQISATRIAAGDYSILIDASRAQLLSASAIQHAEEAGGKAVVLDLRDGRVRIPGLATISAGNLAHMLVTLLRAPARPDLDAQYGALTSWTSNLSLRFCRLLKKGSPTAQLAQALQDPQAHKDWWRQDAGDGQSELDAATQRWQQLSPAIREQHRILVNALEALPDEWESSYQRAAQEGGVIVLQLPYSPRSEASARFAQALAWELPIVILSQKIGRPIGTEETPPEKDLSLPGLLMILDLPFSSATLGSAIMPAQGRAIGQSIFHIGPQSGLSNDTVEGREWVNNCNTKIVVGPREELSTLLPWASSIRTRIEADDALEEDQAIVVFREDLLRLDHLHL